MLLCLQTLCSLCSVYFRPYASYALYASDLMLLLTLCTSISSVCGRSTLHLVIRGFLVIPWMQSAIAQSRSFAFVALLPGTIFICNCGFSSSAFLFFFIENAWRLPYPVSDCTHSGREHLWIWVALYKCSFTITIKIELKVSYDGIMIPVTNIG